MEEYGIIELVIAMKKIDVHTHLIGNICGIGSEGELTPIGGGKAIYASGKVIQLIPEKYGDKSLTPEVLLSVLKENDVEFSVCLQGNYAGFQNIYTYEASLKYPDKLISAGTYDPFFRNKQLIVKHLFDDLGIKVLKMEVSNGSGLMANHPTVDLNGDVMNEVYQMAQAHQLVCFMDIGRPGNNCYQVEALAEAIKKYPKIPFIICHLTAPQHEQMHILEENLKLLNLKNVYFDIASLPNNTKQPYPFYEAQDYIRKAIDIMGKQKILWGSDFPAAMNYCSYQEAYRYIEESTLFTEEEKEHILYRNAKALFGGLIS
ncbi:MAG: amidohydrolase [Anaeroplasmataceae bacterium]|nr:amidohydrolase [Anaeroplasmataceae bacterium]MDE6413873.1 amidohydrolase [Anaeroplasmataceae bacterium]